MEMGRNFKVVHLGAMQTSKCTTRRNEDKKILD